ncbi:hypothetical protein EV356DRAFT_491452 [Viridothelium virens]|uniref:EF-hand domain-containing protein n=1 Tax=Viridothelium virens TaxID=1048519 RepID=A0A6A6GXZ1_VIRVR|nr:hypothetical protein EV356DRAFT_491452 [Viridothelium virens]
MSTSPYKPSPLSFNSPRRSPFQRSDSRPGSPLTVRASTPAGISQKPSTPTASPEKRGGSSSPWASTRATPGGLELPASPSRNPSRDSNVSDESAGFNATTTFARPTSSPSDTGDAPSPLRQAPSLATSTPIYSKNSKSNHSNPDVLSHLPPAQLRSMRESFQVLDDKNTGSINAVDVSAMLQQLGLDSSPATLSTFFPPSSSGSMSLATYLNNLASLLAPLSSQEELVAAFAAFDDDDSGEVDLKELKDAVMNTAPGSGDRAIAEREFDAAIDGFKGRRTFGKGSAGGIARGEVFKYRDFVASIVGGANNEGRHAIKG